MHLTPLKTHHPIFSYYSLNIITQDSLILKQFHDSNTCTCCTLERTFLV